MKKLLKNEFKSNKAITLIALIITVVVMLILAGVAISAVIDSEGLFSKTKAGAELYSNAIKDEKATLSNLMNYIDRYLMGGTTTPGGENGGNTGGAGGEEPLADTTAPEIATIEVANIGETTFTLVATGADSQSGVAKYEFYINTISRTFSF